MSLRLFWNQVGRHGFIYLAAESLAKGGIYVLFLWLATLMPVDDFGLLNVFISLLTLFGVAVSLGLPEAVVRFHFSGTDFRPALGMAMTLPAGMAVVLLLAITPWRADAALALNIPSWLLLLAIAAAPLFVLRQTWLGVLRARGDSGQYLLLRMLEPALFLSAIAVLVLTRTSVAYGGTVVAYVAAIGGVAAVGIIGVALRVGLTLSMEPLRRLVLFSLPLVGHGLAMTGLGLFDQVVLQQLLGAQATGRYAFAYRFAMAMSLVVAGFTAAWGPLVLQRLSEGRGRTLQPLAKTAFRLLLGASVLLSWLIPPVAASLGGRQYAQALHLIPLIVYGYLWVGLYAFGVGHLYFRHRTKTLAAASGTAFLVNAAFNYLTVPHWGTTAAAVTTLLSYVLLALLVWWAQGNDRSELPWGSFVVQATLAGPVILAASAFYA